MPKVHTKKARKNIYRNGSRIPDKTTKSGYRMDRSKPKDENDTIVIPEGATYYMWSFRYGPTIRSLNYPRMSQLTHSEYLGSLYCIIEEIEDSEMPLSHDGLEEFKTNISDQFEIVRDETQEKLDNMPESLQYSPTGELLQERIDAIEEIINEIESFDLDEDTDIGQLHEDFQDIDFSQAAI